MPLPQSMFHYLGTPRTWRDSVLDCLTLKNTILIMGGIMLGFMAGMIAVIWVAGF